MRQARPDLPVRPWLAVRLMAGDAGEGRGEDSGFTDAPRNFWRGFQRASMGTSQQGSACATARQLETKRSKARRLGIPARRYGLHTKRRAGMPSLQILDRSQLGAIRGSRSANDADTSPYDSVAIER